MIILGVKELIIVICPCKISIKVMLLNAFLTILNNNCIVF